MGADFECADFEDVELEQRRRRLRLPKEFDFPQQQMAEAVKLVVEARFGARRDREGSL